MKQQLWITLATYLAYCIDKELYKAIDYLREQVRVLLAERFVKSVKSECLDYLILSSVEQLEYVLNNYRDYYHHERIHQSLGRIIEPMHETNDDAEIACIERLGGLLKSYHRLAA